VVQGCGYGDWGEGCGGCLLAYVFDESVCGGEEGGGGVVGGWYVCFFVREREGVGGGRGMI